MKEDKDLLKELLQTKFKDDIIQSSSDSFDHIFDAVQEESDDKSLFLWYTVGVIVLMLTGVMTLFYFLNDNAPNSFVKDTNTEIPAQKEDINLVTIATDSIAPSKKQEAPIVPLTDNSPSEIPEQEKEEIVNKKIVDVTTLTPEDEIIEKGVITVTYTASDKYASTEQTKYNKLPDSSTIVVRKNSRVNFTASKQGYRRADIKGTVFLNSKDDISKPFIIFAAHCKIQITGNSFAIHSDTEADRMTLISGSATVVHSATKEVKNLNPGESIKVNQKGIFTLSKSPNMFAWKTGNLTYNNASVNQIITDLDENYEAKILLKNADILNCKYSGTFKNTNTLEVLTKLKRSLKLQMTKKDGIFIITGQGCNK